MEELGVVASTIQIADVALRAGREIYAFLDELAKAGQNVRRLQDVFMELQGMIGDIHGYMIEAQDHAPRLAADPTRSPVPTSLIRAVQQFHEDVSFLRQCLPDTMVPRMAAKIKFVFQKSKVQEATKRLEESKATTILALCVIGRRNDITVLTGVQAVQSSLNAIATKQQSSMDEARQLSAAQHSEIMSQTETITTMLRSLRIQAQGSSATPTPQDMSALTRLLGMAVRSEIRDLLAPVLQRFEQFEPQLDAVAASLCEEVSRQEAPPKLQEQPAETPSSCPKCSSVASTGDRTEPAFDLGTPAIPRVESGSQIVTLYTIAHTHGCALAGWLTIQVTKCRRRGLASGGHHRIVLRYRPPRWLLAVVRHGISLAYSTGPDQHGYYSLAPSVRPIHIIPYSLEQHQAFRDDDVLEFRLLLDSGEFTLGCEDRYRFTLLDAAMTTGASRITHFLLNQTPTGSFQGRISSGIAGRSVSCYVIAITNHIDNGLQAAHEHNHIELIREYVEAADALDCDSFIRFVFHMFVSDHWASKAGPYSISPSPEDIVSSLLDFVLREAVGSGFIMEASIHILYIFPLLGQLLDLFRKYLHFLRLYLDHSGDPSTVLHGCPSIRENSLSICIKMLIRLEECNLQKAMGLAGEELELRLRAGADPYAIVNADVGPATTLCAWAARVSGAEVVWRRALQGCGYIYDEVVATSNRRLKEYLAGRGKSSVVDVDGNSGPSTGTEGPKRRRAYIYHGG